VETDFSNVRFHGDTERAATVYADTIPLSADDVAEAVVWCASRPLRVNIHEVIMRPIYQSSSYHLQRGMDRAAWEAAQSS
jgi:NADP-dependent 3-hydroxy acid dehydrogenase YdfG